MAGEESGGSGGGVVLGSAVAKVSVDSSGMTAGVQEGKRALTDLEKQAEKTGQGIDRGIKKGADSVKNAGSSFRESLAGALPVSVGVSIGTVLGDAVVAGLQKSLQFAQTAINDYVEQGVALGKLSQVTGAAAEDLSALQLIAAESEIEFNAFAQSMTLFSRKLVESKGPTADMKAELFALSDQFQSMPDGPAKTALAMEAFGRSGAQMIPILNQGSAALKQYMADMEASGQVIDSAGVAAANRYDDAMDRLNRSTTAVSRSIGGLLVPSIADGAEAIASVLAPTTTWETKLRLLQAVTSGNVEALRIYASGMAAAAATTTTAANAAGNAIPVFQELGLTLDQLQKQYADMRVASDKNAAFLNSQTAAAGRLAEREARDLDRREIQIQKIREYNQVEFDRVTLMKNADREQARLERGTISLTKEQQEAEAQIDKINQSFEAQTAGAGGAAKATDELTESTDALAKAQERLEQRTGLISGAIGGSLAPMSAAEKFQKAWAIATGQTTLEAIQQEAAVKGVMKALEEKSISEEDALATLLALQTGFYNASEAMNEAGDPAKQYAADVDSVAALAQAAAAKIDKLAIGVNTLPAAKRVGLSVEVTGGQALLDAHERMAEIASRNVTLTVNVAGLDKLREIQQILQNAGYYTSPFGPAPAGAAGAPAPGNGATTTAPAPSPAPATTNPDPPSEQRAGRGSARGVTVVQVGNKVVAEAVTGEPGVVKANTRRSWNYG